MNFRALMEVGSESSSASEAFDDEMDVRAGITASAEEDADEPMREALCPRAPPSPPPQCSSNSQREDPPSSPANQPKVVGQLNKWYDMDSPVDINREQAIKWLKRVYPLVEDLESLPSCWASNPRGKKILLSKHNRRVQLTQQKDDVKASVRANKPIPADVAIYYFEVVVHSERNLCSITLGYGCDTSDLNAMPGSGKNSSGVNGYDGEFNEEGVEISSIGCTFAPGDVVGFGYIRDNNSFFITKNGSIIDERITARGNFGNLAIYPMVGLRQYAEVLDTNFGERIYLFDILSHINRTERSALELIRKLCPSESRYFWMNTAIYTWFAHQGYYKTLKAFAERNTVIDSVVESLSIRSEREESMKFRGAIKQLILNGQSDKAVEKLSSLYPSLLFQNRELDLLLKCQRFIEMIANSCNIKLEQVPQTHSTRPAMEKGSDPNWLCSGLVCEGYCQTSAELISDVGLSYVIDCHGFLKSLKLAKDLKLSREQKIRQDRAHRIALRPGFRLYPRKRNNIRHLSPKQPCVKSHNSSNGVTHHTQGDSNKSDELHGLTVEIPDDIRSSSNGSIKHEYISPSRFVLQVPRPRISSMTIFEELDDEFMERNEDNDSSSNNAPPETDWPLNYNREKIIEAIKYGKIIQDILSSMDSPKPCIVKYVEDVLSLICQSQLRQSSKSYLFGSSVREVVASAVNTSIYTYLGYPPESMLSIFHRYSKDMRRDGLKRHGILASAGINAAIYSKF